LLSRSVIKNFSFPKYLEIEKGRHQNIPLNEQICKLCKLEIEDEIHFLLQCPILNSFRTEAMQQISDICKHFATLDNKSKFIWLLSNENIIIINIVIKLYRYMHNIYYTTKLDVIIQCELGREPGGKASLPDNNLVLVSVNDINSFMTILIMIIFSFESNQINLDLLSNVAKCLQISEICCIAWALFQVHIVL
jgi:hypothetical protein